MADFRLFGAETLDDSGRIFAKRLTNTVNLQGLGRAILVCVAAAAIEFAGARAEGRQHPQARVGPESGSLRLISVKPTVLFARDRGALVQKPQKEYTARKPLVSSLRRNLQREHLELLMDLSKTDYGSTSAYKAISNLVMEKLRWIQGKLEGIVRQHEKNLDPYTKAHLKDAATQIKKALDAHYVYKSL